MRDRLASTVMLSVICHVTAASAKAQVLYKWVDPIEPAQTVSPATPSVSFVVGYSADLGGYQALAVAQWEVVSSEPGLGNVDNVLKPVAGPIPGWPQAGSFQALGNGFLITAGQSSGSTALSLVAAFTVDWSTSDFSPRTVTVTFEQLAVHAYPWLPLPANTSGPSVYTYTITVIPAPASTAIFAAAGVHALRRRRASMKNDDSGLPDRRPPS